MIKQEYAISAENIMTMNGDANVATTARKHLVNVKMKMYI